MSHRRTKIAAFAIAGTVGLLTAACAPPGNTNAADSTDAPAANPDPTADATATLAPPVSQQGALDEFTIRIFGAGMGDTSQAAQELAEARHRLQEEIVASCMAEQGFTYIPNLNVTITATVTEGPLRGTREFAELFGFGISMSGPDSEVPGTVSVGTIAGLDPNQATRDAMSDAERAAWDEALFGNWLELAQQGQDFDWTAQGCHGLVNLALFPTVNIPDEFSALRDEVDRFSASVDVHPDMFSLNAEWMACLAGFGYSGWPSSQQLVDWLWQEWWLINDLRTADQDARVAVLLEWNWEAAPDGPPGWSTDEQGEGFWEETDLDVASAVATFREREMALALADFQCRESLDFDARALTINHQHQQEFVDRNLNELEAWATWVEQHRQSPGG